MQAEVNKISFLKNDHIRHIVRYLIGCFTAAVGIADMLSAIVPKSSWSDFLGVWLVMHHRLPAQTFTVVVGFFPACPFLWSCKREEARMAHYIDSPLLIGSTPCAA